MAKKQQRYRAADLVSALPAVTGNNVSLILTGGEVYQVKIKSFQKDHLIVVDGLQRLHKFSLEQIEEVIVEKHG